MIVSNKPIGDIGVNPFFKMSAMASHTAYTATKKISDLAIAFFDFISQIMQKISGFVWAEKKVTPKRKDLGFAGAIIKDGFELAKQKDALKNQPKPINTFLTYAFEAATIFAPISLSIGSQSTKELSFLRKQGTVQVATDSLKPTITDFFGVENLDMDQLTRHDMILKGDDIDHAIYQFGAFAAATATNALTLGLLNPPLHMLFSAVAGLPPVENAIMSLKFPKYLSEVTHKIGTEGRSLIKSLVIKVLEPCMVSTAVKLEKKAINALGNPSFNFGKVGNKIVKVLVQKEIKTPLAEKLATKINDATNALADSIVDTSLTKSHEIAKSTIEAYFTNKSIQAAYMKGPLFGVVSIVVTNGDQSAVGIAFCVAKVAAIYLSGPAIIPMIIYGPYIVNFLIGLKNAYDIVQAEENEAVEIVEEEAAVELKEAEIALGKEEIMLEPYEFMGTEPVVIAPKTMEAGFKEEVMLEPYEFMGTNPVVEAPKATEEQLVKQAAFGQLMGIDEDEILVEDNSPSVLDNLVTSLFFKKQEEVDEEAVYMMGF